MKKFVSIIIVCVLAFSIVACTQEEEDTRKAKEPETTPQEEEVTEGEYKDGTYEGKGDPWEYGSEDATVVIENEKIEEITLRRLDKEGNEVNYDDWTGQEVDGKTYPNLKQYREDMANEMIEKQSYEVDTISGATVSTNNWKIAVKRALEEASK